MRRQTAGFTLVELLITLAITALLLLASVPFARDWVLNNRQMLTRQQVLAGVAQARALGLRNPEGLQAPAPGTAAVIDKLYHRSDADGRHWLEVVRMAPAGAASVVAWHGRLPALGEQGQGLQISGLAAGQCVAFGPRGRVLDAAPATGCVAPRALTVRVDGDARGLDNVPLH